MTPTLLAALLSVCASLGALIVFVVRLLLRHRARRAWSRLKPLPPMVWVDVETGGLNEHEHEILEIAAVRVEARSQRVLGTFHRYVLPTKPVDPEAAAKNGYNEAGWQLARAIPLADALQQLAPFLEGATQAGQHPNFDRRFLVASYARLELRLPKAATHRMVDVIDQVQPFLVAGLIESASLDASTSYFGIKLPAHRALSDVHRAMAVYAQIMAIFVPAAQKFHARRA